MGNFGPSAIVSTAARPSPASVAAGTFFTGQNGNVYQCMLTPEGVRYWGLVGQGTGSSVIAWNAVTSFGAVGDGTADDTAALQAADAYSAVHGGYTYLPAGSYRIKGTVTAISRWKFDPDAIVIAINGETGVLALTEGYEAPLTQVFDSTIDVRISYGTTVEAYPEHWGAVRLLDPRSSTTDSTAALQKMFESFTGAIYNSNNAYTPGMYDGRWIRFAGIYGISGQVSVNVSSMRILGNGATLTGSGLKWIGAPKAGNDTQAMLRFYGAQNAVIDGLVFLGAKTTVDAERLFAAVAFDANPNTWEWTAPFNGEFPRGCVISNCMFGDQIGYFTQGGSGYQFKHAIATIGQPGNNDFHTIENVQITNCIDAIYQNSSQNVYWDIINTRVTACYSSVIWTQGGQLGLDLLYVGSLPSTCSVIRLGTSGAAGDPDLMLTSRLLGGEVNSMRSFIHNEQSNSATVRASFDHTFLEMFGADFQTGLQCVWQCSFRNGCFNNVVFTIANDSPGNRCSLLLDGCRALSNIRVVNGTSLGSIDVDVRACWGENFAMAPSSYVTAGRFVGPINYRKRFIGNYDMYLDDASLYATSEMFADRIGVGDPGFGAVARISSRAYLTQTVNAISNDVPCVAEAVGGVLMMGAQAILIDSNYLADVTLNTAYALLLIGDSTNPERFGRISGPGGFSRSYPTPSLTPFYTYSQNVRLTGAYNINQTFTWAGNQITVPLAQFLPAMAGGKFLVQSDTLAGVETSIVSVDSATQITVADSHAGTGVGVVLVPLKAGNKIQVSPLYIDPFKNAVDMLNGNPQNLLYAEPVTATAVP